MTADENEKPTDGGLELTEDESTGSSAEDDQSSNEYKLAEEPAVRAEPAVAQPLPPSDEPTTGPQPPRLPSRHAAKAPSRQAAEWISLAETINRRLASPLCLRIVGRVSAGLAILILAFSIFLWAWGKTWFSGVVGLTGVFVVCEGLARIIELLDRPATKGAATGEARR